MATRLELLEAEQTKRSGVSTRNRRLDLLLQEEATRTGDVSTLATQQVIPQEATQTDPASLTIKEMFKQAGRNLIPSGVNVMKSIVQAVSDPQATFDTLSRTALGAIGNELGIDVGKDTKAFEQAAQFFKDRYGGIENIKRTVAEDPVGVLTDISTIASGSGAFIKAGGTASKIAKAATLGDPIVAGGKAIAATANRFLPKASTSLIKTAIKPSAVSSAKLTERQRLARANQLANEFIDRGLKFDEPSIQALQGAIKDSQREITSIIGRGTFAGKTIKTSDMLKGVDDLLAETESLGIRTPQINKKIDALNRFVEKTLADSPETLTPAQAQNFKKILNLDYIPNPKSAFQAISNQALDRVRDTTKQLLEAQFPELKTLNPNQGVMIELEKALTKRLRTLEEQPFIGSSGLQSGAIGGALGAIISGQAGGSLSEILLKAGGFGVGAFVAEKVIKSPGVQVAIARALNQANKLAARTGDLSRVTQPAFQAGRLQEEIEQ